MGIVAETELEQRILADPEWQEGVAWGVPRSGHPEGAVSVHIEEVLANVDEVAVDERDRERLRFVALVHDSFKYRVDQSRPKTGENHHATIARRFAERYTDDRELLEVIELHDEAYNAWRKGRRQGWDAGEARARRLLERLGDSTPFYLRFYDADNRTGDKSRENFTWFQRLAGSGGTSAAGAAARGGSS